MRKGKGSCVWSIAAVGFGLWGAAWPEPDSLFGVRWGASPAEVQRLWPNATCQWLPELQCRIEQVQVADRLTAGAASFHFRNDTLTEIRYVISQEDVPALLAFLRQTYGGESLHIGDLLVWEGKRVEVAVHPAPGTQGDRLVSLHLVSR